MPSNQRIREYMLEINSIINILSKNDKNKKISEDGYNNLYFLQFHICVATDLDSLPYRLTSKEYRN